MGQAAAGATDEVTNWLLQRLKNSFDAVVTISAVLAFLAYLPDVRQWSRRRWIRVSILGLCLSVFGFAFANSLKHAQDIVRGRLHKLEAESPP